MRKSARRGLPIAVLAFAALSAAAPARAQVSDPDQMCSPAADPCVISSAFQVTSDAMLDFGERSVVITAAGRLNSPGGNIAIFAHALQMDPSSQINVRGSSSAGGGSVDLSITTDVSISGTIDVTGNSGGSITITAETVELQSSGRLIADGINSEASGGNLDVSADEITLLATSIIRANSGSAAAGGTLTLGAATRVTLAGTVEANGGNLDAGILDVTSGGGVLIPASGTLRLNGNLEGSGGELSLSAGDLFMGEGSGDLLVQGAILVNGGGEGGTGGVADLAAANACQLLGRILLQSGADAEGGSLTVSCSETGTGDMTMNAEVDARGIGAGAVGGDIDLSTGEGAIQILNKINVSGGGGGGTISIDGSSGITVEERISANSGEGEGGEVSLTATGLETSTVRFTEAGSVTVDGAGGSESPGGALTVEACRVRIDSRGQAQTATALGQSGSISIIGVRLLDIAGRMSAGPSMGVIELKYRDSDPLFESTASFNPSPILTLDENNPLCGSPLPTRTATRTIAGPSPTNTPVRNTPVSTPTRTRTSTPSGPTATHTPRPTPAGPTDANCNGVIDADEAIHVVSAIFNPTLAEGCEPTNADGEGGITVADVLALLVKMVTGE